jgi:transcriptional regulator with XRE-family HTH domain
MFTNKAKDGRNNLCGEKIAQLRKQMIPKVSQRALADMLQITGLDLDKNAIQRIESGKRFVTDIELLAFASVFGVEIGSLLDDESVSK